MEQAAVSTTLWCVIFADKSDNDEGGCSDNDDDNDGDSDVNDEEQKSWLAELSWRKQHPERLHEELWFNLPHEVL